MKIQFFVNKIKRSFEIEVTFVKHFLHQTCILATFTKVFGSDERLIQFLLSLYPMLLFTLTPFKPPLMT